MMSPFLSSGHPLPQKDFNWKDAVQFLLRDINQLVE